MLILLLDGFYFDSETGTVLKATGEDSCALFPCGASAVDGGFSLPCAAERAADAINESEMKEDEDAYSAAPSRVTAP